MGGAAPPGEALHRRRLWVRAVSVVPIASLIPFAFVAVYPLASARLAAGEALPFTILAAAMAGLIYTFSILILLAPDVPARGCSDTVRHTELPPAGSRCRDEQSMWIAEKLRGKLIAGAYRDSEVSLHSLAAQLHVTPNRLSMVVNHVFGQTFRELVNRCRIDYFVRHVLNHALEEQSILDLAFEAGFSSKSTFNRVFKEHIGMSPSCYAVGLAERATVLDS
jgi:AraC-like DNA-binding protein